MTTFDALAMPPDTVIRRFRNNAIAYSRNRACQAMLDGDADWLLFLDDDMEFRPDMLEALLRHDKPIISATYLNRKWPFHVCAYDKWLDVEGLPHPRGVPVMLVDGMKGVVPIVAAGCGCLLIQRSVIAEMAAPWFTLTYNYPDRIAEDFSFFRKVAEGEAWLDLDCWVGHMNHMTLWPHRVGEKWLSVIEAGGGDLPIPSAVELLEERLSWASGDE